MKKFILALCITALTAVFTAAQAPADDYKKVEGYVGYSNGQVDTGLDSGSSAVDFFRDRETFHGFNASGVYNLNRYFGVKGDISGTYNNTRFNGTFDVGGSPANVSFKTNNSLYNFLGGVQVKDNAKSGRFKPFAHALVGAGHVRTKISDFACSPTALCATVVFPDESFSETGFAGAFGGGLDIRVNDKFQIRAFQVDYNPVRIEGSTQHNARFGAGIVF
jgi:opacity protein-like surface antigen